MLASQMYFSCKPQQVAMLAAAPPMVSAPVHQQPFHSLFAVSTACSFRQPRAKWPRVISLPWRIFKECRFYWKQWGHLFLVTFIIHLSKNWGLKPHRDMHYRCHYFSDKCIKWMSKSNPNASLTEGTVPQSLHTTILETCNLFCCSSLFHLSHTYKRSKKFIPTNSPSAQVGTSQASGLSWILQRKTKLLPFTTCINLLMKKWQQSRKRTLTSCQESGSLALVALGT